MSCMSDMAVVRCSISTTSSWITPACWFKRAVLCSTSCGKMTISFYKKLTRSGAQCTKTEKDTKKYLNKSSCIPLTKIQLTASVCSLTRSTVGWCTALVGWHRETRMVWYLSWTLLNCRIRCAWCSSRWSNSCLRSTSCLSCSFSSRVLRRRSCSCWRSWCSCVCCAAVASLNIVRSSSAAFAVRDTTFVSLFVKIVQLLSIFPSLLLPVDRSATWTLAEQDNLVLKKIEV